MTPGRLRPTPALGVLALVCLVVALWTFVLGGEDQRYQLADLREDPLYLRGPGPRIIGGAVLTVLVLVVAFVTRAIVGRSQASAVRSTPSGGPSVGAGGIRPDWWWSVPVVLVAAWVGYVAGSAATVATGGPVDHPGTMRLAFGAPIGGSVDVPATCRTPPGRPATVATVSSEAAGLRLDLLDPVTGATRLYPEPFGVFIERAIDRGGGTGAGGPALVVPGLPDRPPMYTISPGWGVDAVHHGPPIEFIDAYLYVVSDATVTDRGGSIIATATRAYAGAFVVNDLIPDDPWVETYELAITWTCDLSTKVPATIPAAAPGSPTPGPSSTPQPPSWSSPASTALPAGAVPVELWIVTGSEDASVRIEGASVASVGPPGIQGRATATYTGDMLRVAQPASDSAAGRVVGARFPVTLTGLTAGTPLRLTVGSGPTGKVAVTVYNVLGGEPVPVFVNLGTSAERPGWPIEVDTRSLVTPVRFEQAW